MLSDSLAWYQAHGPTSDAQVAAHFASKRPTLGICLKRYGVDANGKLARIDTRLDIPLEIRFPHFIQDEKPENDGPLGNFKLVLQSVVCHRGKSLNGGHYIALARRWPVENTQRTSEERNSTESRDGDRENEMWLKFDDLDSPERVRLVNIKDALDNEMPYLLFYQIQPIDEELPPIYETGSSGSSTVVRLSEAEDVGVSTAVGLEGRGELDTEEVCKTPSFEEKIGHKQKGHY
jgi:Ubiquitin carboxyl-terminal hydrolase